MRNNLSLLLSIGEAESDVLCPVLGSPIPEKHRQTVENPAQGHQDYEETVAPLL